MKKHIFIISTILILSTIINVSAFSNASHSKSLTLTDTTAFKETRYILKDYNGQIALFTAESSKPVEVFEIFTSSLPQKDIAAIKQGISVTQSELKSLLEEYTS